MGQVEDNNSENFICFIYITAEILDVLMNKVHFVRNPGIFQY